MAKVKAVEFDFRYAGVKPNGKPELDPQGRPPSKQGGRPAKVMSDKQIRARARRKQKMLAEELALMWKPVSEWDAEELARGRPRDKAGGFRGKSPEWVDRAVHEEAIKRFQSVVKSQMNLHTIEALEVLRYVLNSDDTDDRGKPLVSANVRLDAAKFLLEHVVGKPKQRVETDISVKLQAMLGTAMVNPAEGGFELAQGYIDAEVVSDSDDDYEDNDGG